MRKFTSGVRFMVILSMPLISMLVGCREGTISLQEPESVPQELPEKPSHENLQHVTLIPYWVTTAQFAGYYVGQDQGIFAKYGIDLEVIPYQPSMSMPDLIKNHEATFYLFWLVNAIEYRAAGLDIVNIAQLSSRSSLMLITKKSSGIEIIEDMDGKRMAVWQGYELQPSILFKRHKVDVRLIPIGSTNNLFLMDGAEITNASWFDEYHTLMNSGYDSLDLETFFFYEMGLNFLEDGIYTNQSTVDGDPDLCRRFVQATIESWVYAFRHPEETIELVLKERTKMRMAANKAHQRWMLNRYEDLYYPVDNGSINTTLNKNEYQDIAKILKEAAQIREIPPFDQFYQPVAVSNPSSPSEKPAL
jgi:NitT/TauT family transport system substrate-binding protein